MLGWIIIGFVIWIVMGAVVLSGADNKKQYLYKWYAEAPHPLLQVGVLFCWPIAVYKFRKKRN
jgi:hypothetical protein